MLSAILGCTFILVVALVLIVLLVRVKSAHNSEVVLILINIYNIKTML